MDNVIAHGKESRGRVRRSLSVRRTNNVLFRHASNSIIIVMGLSSAPEEWGSALKMECGIRRDMCARAQWEREGASNASDLLFAPRDAVAERREKSRAKNADMLKKWTWREAIIRDLRTVILQ